VLLGLAATGGKGEVPAVLLDAFRATLTDTSLDPSLASYSLALPDYSTLSQVCIYRYVSLYTGDRGSPRVSHTRTPVFNACTVYLVSV